MAQDDYSSTLTPLRSHMEPGLLPRRSHWTHLWRYLLISVGLTLLLTCIEGGLWILNPAHLLGNDSSHTLITFFALPARMPVLFLVPLGELALAFWLTLLSAQPLARRAYLKAVYLAQEGYRERYTPLQSWSNPYPVPLVYDQDDPNPTMPRQSRTLSTSELAEKILTDSFTHLILLGATGAGKTMFVHEFLSLAARRSHEVAFGSGRLPVFLPLKYYALFCQGTGLADFSLLDFLAALEMPGMKYLRPHLNKLFQQGRLLLLCDGLDEVPVALRPALDQELALLFHQSRNGLLLTCSSITYEQAPELVRAVGENLVPRAVFPPLKLVDIRRVTERFIEGLDSSYGSHLPTAGQIMALIEQSHLRALCGVPLYLFAFLRSVTTLPLEEVKRLSTRGRLLQAFLLSRLPRTARDSGEVPAELAFLADLACVARWSEDTELLFLPQGGFLALDADASARPQAFSEEQIDTVAFWSREQQVVFPFSQDTVFLLAETIDPEQGLAFLVAMQEAALLEINEQGILSFQHTLLTSALVAEYLARFLGVSALRVEAIEAFPAHLTSWSEPMALWAGLLEEPLEACTQLARYAQAYPAQAPAALLLSLICLGVAAVPPEVDSSQVLVLPPALADALSLLLRDFQGREELARLFTECAKAGAPELYQALFPLLALADIEAFLMLLDANVVSDLFFSRLIAVIDEANQEALVKRLVRALSAWGAVVVPRAAGLAVSNTGGRLRTAAINVLGGTRDRSAVEPLMICLRDTDQFIVGRAANALARLGPSLTLPRLISEAETPSSASGKKSLHWIILPIFERFLNETSVSRRLTPEQVEHVIAALMRIQATHTDLADLEKVREILVGQSRMAAERDSGKIALNLMVRSLATSDDTVARHTTGALKEVGTVATPHLLEQLEHSPSEAERVRILEVLTSVRDPRALASLLRLLEDPSMAVQQALATALRVYVPDCISGLIEVVLHHSNELIAIRAEQILCGWGEVVVEQVLRALTPLVEGRTLLLVHVLECTRDTRAVPRLIELLSIAESDISLSLAVVEALGQCGDQRAVSPLLEVLASSNTLLSEGAINALSSLGEPICPVLLGRLDVPEKTPVVARIERVFLAMQPFPGPVLLQTVEKGSVYQVKYIEEIFLMRGTDAAQLLAGNLFHSRPQVRERMRQTMGRMEARYSVPALLEMLGEEDPAKRALVASYLLDHPRESIPPLVGLLDDPERAETAVEILLQAGQPVLPALVPALDVSSGPVAERASSILVTLAQRQPELLSDVVQLFALSLPPIAHETVQRLLTDELADRSLPALLQGLEDAHMVPDVSETLVRLARRDAASQMAVLSELLQALSLKARRHGAAVALIAQGALAVPGVGSLITSEDPQIARTARHILVEIGTPAFPFIWAAHSDTSDLARREAAREVFRSMPTGVVKDELVMLLTSARQEDISMALSLLLERISDEALQPGQAGEMLPALLEHVQVSNDERANQRVMALLILLGSGSTTQALIDALYSNPQGHTALVDAFLLMDQSVEADLLDVLRDVGAPVQLQAEIAGILAMRAPHKEVHERALSLSEHGLWAGRSAHKSTTVLHDGQLDISLHSLGGLLVGGHWSARELQTLRASSGEGSAERELYDVLLGWRYTPQLTRLGHELESEREERRKDMLAHTKELLAMKAQTLDLEHDLEQLQQEHQQQQLAHERASQDFRDDLARVNQENQVLQASLKQAQQEKQALTAQVLAASSEKEQAQAELLRWKTFGEQLQIENNNLRRPRSNA